MDENSIFLVSTEGFEGGNTDEFSTCPAARLVPLNIGVSLVAKYSHQQEDALQTIVRPWLTERNKKAAELSNNLPDEQTLTDEQRDIVVANPMARLVKVHDI